MEKDKIKKYGILGGKTEFTILDRIWMKNGQMTNRSLEKLSKSTIVAENGDYTMLSRPYTILSSFSATIRRFW